MSTLGVHEVVVFSHLWQGAMHQPAIRSGRGDPGDSYWKAVRAV